jgi:putative thymidine phosphorylase
MKLKVKSVDISTGESLIALMNKKDAVKLDLYQGDRIKIKNGKKSIVTALDVTTSSTVIKPGRIGMFNDLLNNLKFRDGQTVKISIAEKPISIHYIKKKLKGEKLNYEEINTIIKDTVNNVLTTIELTYFVAGCYVHELTIKETIHLTNAILNNGEILKFNTYPIVDKHCIGGVAGNRTTPIVVAICASAGLTMPKTSSRSITSPAGTADTMEVFCNVSMSVKEVAKVVKKTNACLIWGGAVNLAPADDKIIRVEHPISLDPVGQLLASILAKKKSVSATHLLIDIPVGKGAKIEKESDAESLKRRFEIIGKELGFKIKVVLTDGKQPVGNGLGPALEARDVLLVLQNAKNAPQDLKEKSIQLAGYTLELADKVKPGYGNKLAREILESGLAQKKFFEIVKAQGGKKMGVDEIEIGKFKFSKLSAKSGKVKSINGKALSKIAKVAGAPKDKGAGIFMHHHIGEILKKNEALYTIYSNSKEKMHYAKQLAGEFTDFVIS